MYENMWLLPANMYTPIIQPSAVKKQLYTNENWCKINKWNVANQHFPYKYRTVNPVTTTKL